MADDYKQILEKVLSVTGKIGTNEILKILDNINEYGGGITILLASIKSNLNVSLKQMQNSNRRVDNIYYAKRIFAYLLEKELNYKRKDISIIMRKDDSTPRLYIRTLKEDINLDIPFGKKFKEHLINITNDLKNYLNK